MLNAEDTSTFGNADLLDTVIAHSADIDLPRAIAEVLAQAHRGLNGAVPQAGMIFIGGDLDQPAALQAVSDAFPGLPLIGCSTAGEASPTLGFEDDSILLVLFVSPDLVFAAGAGRGTDGDPRAAVAEAAAEVRDGLDGSEPRLVFLLDDVRRSNPDQELGALREAFGASVPIVGGSAGVYPPGPNTNVFFGGETRQGAVALLAIAGPLDLAVATETSWRPIGRPGVVTEAEGRTIRSIDGAPALDFYRNMLGPDATALFTAPLAVLHRSAGYSVRSPMQLDETDRTIEIAGSVAAGETVQLAFATVDDVLAGADQVVDRTLAQYPAGRRPSFLFFCSCGTRKMFLALDVRREIEAVRQRVGPDLPVVGFYGFGEFGSASVGDPARFYNQTIVMAALG